MENRERLIINGQMFSIVHLTNNNLYIVSKWDGEEFRVPLTRAEFKTRGEAYNRIMERANN